MDFMFLPRWLIVKKQYHAHEDSDYKFTEIQQIYG